MNKNGRFVAILYCAVLAACVAPSLEAAGSAMYLQTIDVIEVGRGESGWQAEFSRRVGVGQDSVKKTSFDATVIDILPVGCKLLSPRPGKVEVQAVDGKKCPITVSLRKKGKGTELRLGFKGVPSLPAGQACCGCAGSCGRACSIQFSYRTNAVGNPKRWSVVNCSPSPAKIAVGKTSRVRVAIDVSDLSLKDAIVVVTVPNEAGGARFAVKDHSPGLSRVRSAAGSTRLATKKGGIGGGKLTLDLDIKPTKPGKITVPGFVELAGALDKPLRSPPSLAEGEKAVLDHQTYVRIRRNLELTAR